MRPTGRLHLGHLVGALNNWVKLQDEYDCFFMVADWHALMSEYENPSAIKDNILDNTIDWLSCGLTPDKSTIFIQSQVPQHLQLHFILSVLTPLGWLERCPTYKEQLREIANRDISTYGFLGYPVLQAADILLYKANAVPVGEDQLPHLELTREIARRFNSLYKLGVFPEAAALLTPQARLPGLDGRKMSKSYNNFIALGEEPAEIRKKIRSMFTDPLRIKKTDPGHPEKCIVYAYYSLFSPGKIIDRERVCRGAGIGCTECKDELSEAIIKFLDPIRQRRQEILKNSGYIVEVLEDGRKRASAVAERTMSEVKRVINI
jgi:tryptophanyl-tRNA synthetase